jgi:metal-responsive CopG/Arc/MetJ family transcriptional regulator
MMAKTGKPQTYNDVINALTARGVILSAELLEKIDVAISVNKQLGYATREKFVECAIREMLQDLSDKCKIEGTSKDGRKSKKAK